MDSSTDKPAAPQTRIHGQHVFFAVKGASLDAAYAAAAAMGLKLLEAKRLRDDVPGVTADKEIEIEDPADPTKTVKKTVKVLSKMQPGVYRKIADAPENTVGKLARRPSLGLSLQEITETEFTYLCKAMGDPADTL